jgi:type IV pilus assembly protein PilE
MLSRRGFTLMEMTVTVAVVAVVTTVAMVSYSNAGENQRRNQAVTILRNVRNAQELFFVRNRIFATTWAQLGIADPSTNDFTVTIANTTGDDFLIRANRSNNTYAVTIDREGIVEEIGGVGGAPSVNGEGSPRR